MTCQPAWRVELGGFMTALTLAAKVPQRRDATTLSEMTEHQSIADWHLDKWVPIALIFAIAVQTGAGRYQRAAAAADG